MKYKALVHAYNLFIYLSIHSFLFSFLLSFVYLFIYLFIHPFTHLFNKYSYYIHWKLYPLYLHYFTRWVWGRAGACTELHTLYTILSSHDLKFRLFVSLFYVFVCVCMCVCLFGLLVSFALYFYHSE